MPVRLQRLAERDRGLHYSDLKFEVPIAAELACAGVICAGGHIGTRQRCEGFDKEASLVTSCHIAAVDQYVAAAAQRGIPVGEFTRVSGQVVVG